MVAEQLVTLQQFPAKAVDAYGDVEFSRLDRKLAMFRALPDADRALLPEFESRVSQMAECVNCNAVLLSNIAQSAATIRQTARATAATDAPSANGSSHRAADGDAAAVADTDTVTPALTEHDGANADAASDAATNGTENANGLDAERDEKAVLSREVRRGFALLVRDWSEAGAEERNKLYTPLVDAIDWAFAEAQRAIRSLQRGRFRVLVPGAGTGRLAWELARKGFAVEGCEASFASLVIGNYVMNGVQQGEDVVVFPYAHEHSNVRNGAAVTKRVSVPDIDPKDLPATADLAMRAGDFVAAYEGQDNLWDGVASCMAFDVSDACVDFVTRVGQILKPGGVWTMIGPMPCVDGAQGDGIHVSADEFVHLLRLSGFKLVRREVVKCPHSVYAGSLRHVNIDCPLIVAVKVRPAVASA